MYATNGRANRNRLKLIMMISKRKNIAIFVDVIDAMFDGQEPTLQQIEETVTEIWEFGEDYQKQHSKRK